jgi:hypothetical protein
VDRKGSAPDQLRRPSVRADATGRVINVVRAEEMAFWE